jgi:CRISPR system Cascade subunit CasA
LTFNLLTTPWLPVRRADGTTGQITPDQLTATPANPIVALDAPRPDFNGALVQFLIGLLQTACAPADREAWFDRLESPPDPEQLAATFAPFIDAFHLDGDGPRFMQDLDPLTDQKPLPITALLIDTAGSATHFVKDLAQQGFSPATAAMGLYTLQTNAPSGGAGHRTSLRGGGPLSTLILAAPEDGSPATLWQTLWLNVLPADTELFTKAEVAQRPEAIFPWLRPTRTSEKGGKETTPIDVHPLQQFWGMPRRIRLDFESTTDEYCGLTGMASPLLVRQYRTKNYGANYTGAWAHTLTPYNHDPAKGPPTAMHPRGSLRYRHWLGLVKTLDDKKVQRIPAAVVSRFHSYDYGLAREGWRYRLWAFGYDMDNMKPRCWHESTFPLFNFDDAGQRRAFESAAAALIQAAGEFLNNLRNALKDAWFSDKDPRRKKADTGFVEDAFWAETEAPFYDHLQTLAQAGDHALARRAVFDSWHAQLHGYTLDAFERWANAAAIADQSHPKRVAEASRWMRINNHGKAIKALLDLPDKREAA